MKINHKNTWDLSAPLFLSLLIGLLMGVMSLAGFLDPDQIYPAVDVQLDFLANDLISLLLVLPLLGVSIWFSHRGKLLWLLLWPGVLLAILYNYLAYGVGVPFDWRLIVYYGMVIFCGITIFLLIRTVDQAHVRELLTGKVPVRVSSVMLIIIGITFLARSFFMLLPVISGESILQSLEIGVLVADAVVSGIWLTGGILLVRRTMLGFVIGPGLMFATFILFIGIILVVLAKPLISEVPLDLEALITLTGMAIIFLIPAGLFLRGTIQGIRHSGK